MATYVFVHGAWLSAKCWEKVLPLIEAAGHKAIAVDYPGHGKNKDIPIIEQSMETYTQYLVDLLSKQEEPVILVGHSMGGMSISQASSRIPEKVKKLVYVTAFLPKSGQS
ncbi:MAG: alpha/beta fold hydrolase, partial [Lachnospiraceae bacterium]|nr:alpha/beta fold hydrolase [Lachnospiraceae bacterium]